MYVLLMYFLHLAIKYGSIILVASIVVFALKVVAWSIARRVFKELRKERIESMEATADSELFFSVLSKFSLFIICSTYRSRPFQPIS